MTLNYDPSEMTLSYPLSEASDSRPHPLSVAQVHQDSEKGSRPSESKEVKFPPSLGEIPEAFRRRRQRPPFNHEESSYLTPVQ